MRDASPDLIQRSDSTAFESGLPPSGGQIRLISDGDLDSHQWGLSNGESPMETLHLYDEITRFLNGATVSSAFQAKVKPPFKLRANEE